MKKDIHPKYGDATVTCSCGEVWHIKSTRPQITVGICAKCHPFFTGKQKFVDTAGRIDKFNRRYKKNAEARPPNRKTAVESSFGGLLLKKDMIS